MELDAGTNGDPRSRLPPYCSPADTRCDLARQDCDAGLECTLDPNNQSNCGPIQDAETRATGDLCCMDDPWTCAPGMICTGGAARCNGEAGLADGHCSPICCPNAASPDEICGSAIPEEWPGYCDSRAVDSTGRVTLYWTCSYGRPCAPFGIDPCPDS